MCTKVCERPKKECRFRCGSFDGAYLERDVIVFGKRENADDDKAWLAPYHWVEDTIYVCGKSGFCPYWAGAKYRCVMSSTYLSELQIRDKINALVFRNAIDEKALFELNLWFKLLRNIVRSDELIEAYKQDLKARYLTWQEDCKNAKEREPSYAEVKTQRTLTYAGRKYILDDELLELQQKAQVGRIPEADFYAALQRRSAV